MNSPNLALFRRSPRTECRSIQVYAFRIVHVMPHKLTIRQFKAIGANVPSQKFVA